MAQQYDVSLKLLFHHSRGLIARRLFGGPVVEWVNVEQPKVTNMRVDLDKQNSMEWRLADAKHRFGELVNLALVEGPQRVLRREDAVVVLAEHEYEKLTGKRIGFKEFLWAKVQACRH
jgi:antitoxin Phd